ncbi:MAG: hypothetical protein ABI776_12635 [Nocardioidaceae bacterium]
MGAGTTGAGGRPPHDHGDLTPGRRPVHRPHRGLVAPAAEPGPRARPLAGRGVYAWLRGPHYETWAEAEWLRRVGADLLGMSTVPEAIAARELGIELLGLSTVTAVEGPAGSATGIDPSEVVAVAERTAARIGPLLADLLPRALTPR